MDEIEKNESHLTSAAAFVEGGIQEACDDACSICLEAFCDSDPSTVTTCKHEFHLQCILEWCQRSSQCPMCWQAISLKDPTSQELLEAVERERNIRFNPPRNTTIFHHPTLGDFELQHLPVNGNDTELEERIIQHLAAAAAMGRAHHMARREGQRSRSIAQGRPQFLVFSTNPTLPPVGSGSATSSQEGEENEPTPIGTATPTAPLTVMGEEHPQQVPSSGSRTGSVAANRHEVLNNRNSAGQSSPVNTQDRAGPSEFQTFSESLKSRFNAVSMRYKESISKSTRGWKERLFSRNTSVADLGSEVRREVNAGIASVSRLMERLDTREENRVTGDSASQGVEGSSITDGDDPSDHRIAENTQTILPNNGNSSSSCAASSGTS